MTSSIWLPGRLPVGVALFHELGATPAGLRTQIDELAEAGYWVHAPLLPSHGGDPADLRRLTLTEVANSVDRSTESLLAEVPAVVLVGCGLGGCLALLVAARREEQVVGLVTISTPFGTFTRKRARAAITGRLLGRLPPIGPDAKLTGTEEELAGWLPLAAHRLLSDAERAAVQVAPRVVAPALIFQARYDHVVERRDATQLLDRLGSRAKELVWLERSFHQVWLDYDAPEVTERLRTFVGDMSERPRGVPD